ncbi:MAG: ECF transporter S component [Ethanoligenens sp.]
MPNKRKSLRLTLAAVLLVVIIPCVLVAGVLFGDRNYAITSPVILLLSMLPFFFAFEKRKPKARELVPIAVMAAIAAVGRLAFAALPQFKPIVAIVIITAFAFGPEAGFLTGAVSMLASNLFFGQGPWTPWQMFCCGIIGFLAGLLRQSGWLKRRWSICVFGFLSGYLYGMIIDIWSVAAFTSHFTWQTLFAAYVSGFLFDTILGAATAFFLFVLEKPLGKKLERIRVKFGLLEQTE